jgi:YbbR domain-containing protein
VADLPLEVTGLSSHFSLAGSEIPRKVPVRLRGSKLALFSHKYFNRYLGEVQLNLSDVDEVSEFSYELTGDHVVTELEVVRLAADTRVRLHIDELWSRSLPVELRLAGEWPEDVGTLRAPATTPDSVVVTGPARAFAGLAAVRTETLERARHDESGSVDLDLVTPDALLRLAPARVKARLELAALEERTLANVPVIPLVDAGVPEVGVSPPVTDVMVRGVGDSVRTLTADRVSVTVAVGDRAEGVYELPGQAVLPSWLSLLGLAPAEFRVIVGNPPLGAASSDTAAVDGGPRLPERAEQPDG